MDPTTKTRIMFLRNFLRLKNGVILDTETTGLPYNDPTASIVNISVIDLKGHTLADYLVKPPVSIPPEVTKIHGITNAMVKDALTWPELADTLHDILKDRTIGAWNASFDRQMVEREMKRAGRDDKYLWVDLMRPYATATGHGTHYKLERAARDEGITAVQTHLSLGDCQMTLATVSRLVRRHCGASERVTATRHSPASEDLEKEAEKAGF